MKPYVQEQMPNLIIRGAREKHLKNIDLDIPRGKLVVLTGLSGSGKSTLAIDVIYQECQRQYLEAIGMQGIQKPDIDAVRHVSPAILITQNESNRNPRSTVGTLTDMYTDLRMIYEKLAVRDCPHCGITVAAADCREEVVRTDGNWDVYMYCNHCDKRMDKLTRTHFSYNTREGACPTCEGLGQVLTLIEEQIINPSKSLEEGAIAFWDHNYGQYQTNVLHAAFRHYGIPVAPGTPVADYSQIQRSLLYDGIDSEAVKREFPAIHPPKTVAAGRFEGIMPVLWRRISEKGGEAKQLSDYVRYDCCPDCAGERLGQLSREATVKGTRLPELSGLALEVLQAWVIALENHLSRQHQVLVASYLSDLNTKLQRLRHVGLSYLTLDRQVITLSGGERQRVKLAAALDSDLTGVIYVLDEPTIGLHPSDTAGIIQILHRLRDAGNTVLVIEHDPELMREADYIFDLGPGAGRHGGSIVGQGTWEELLLQESSVTGAYLKKPMRKRTSVRSGDGECIDVQDACVHNLKGHNIRIPIGCLVAVSGVSGSGKSTLVFDVLATADTQAGRKLVKGTEGFDRIVTIEQAAISRMKRSNVATYSGVYAEIRKLYGGLKEAKAKGLSAKHFSFNTPGGRCERCEGLGYVTSNMLFFQDIEVSCPVCEGKQFNDDVLSVVYRNHSIKNILECSTAEALALLQDHGKITRLLQLLIDVGLGYLQLGQSLTTLSGGEGQRLKLARELNPAAIRPVLYLMDEPTTGLHPIDVEHFLVLLNRLVEAGHTVIVVEHNTQVIRAADWIIDLGPEGGHKGGEVVFSGTPQALIRSGTSITAKYMREELGHSDQG